MHFLDIDKNSLKKYLEESIKIWNLINYQLKKTSGIHRMSLERLQILYICIRHLKPEIVVETGVAGGSTSFAILSAFEKNNRGKLFSIDIGFSGWFPGGHTVGYLVPRKMRTNWNLIIGNSRNELPKLLNNLKNVDIFFHDSDHSYNHMMFEFETILPYLRKKKVILADDINLNSAFEDFAKKMKFSYAKFYGLGIAKPL